MSKKQNNYSSIKPKHIKLETFEKSRRKNNLFNKYSELLNSKFNEPIRKYIVIGIIIIIAFVIIFGIVSAINAHLADVEHKKQIRIEEEERQRQIEEEQARIWVLKKEVEVTYTLKSLDLPYKRLDVPILNQYPELPAACEAIALTNMMNYYGFNLSKTYLVENYLEFDSDDWVHYYVGNLYDAEWGGLMMCPAIKRVFDNYIAEHPAPFKGFDVTGRNFEDLFAYIERGHPVQIWSSLNMEDLGEPASTMDGYCNYYLTHSVLLTGFDRENGIVYVADSINGDCYYSIEKVKSIFEEQSKQAFVIISQEELDRWIWNTDWSYDDTIPKDEDNDEDNQSEE